MAGKTEMEKQFSEIQEQINQPPTGAPVRNINYDVHVGHATQRPYARLEDQMAQLNRGWRSVDELQAALPDGDKVYDDNGYLYRLVVEGTGPAGTYMKDGKLVHRKVKVRRAVSLTLEGAKAASQNAEGVETDYFDGFTWWRRGLKPEKDANVMAHQAAHPEEEFEEDADPSEAAAFQAITVAAQARKPVAPMAPPEGEKK